MSLRISIARNIGRKRAAELALAVEEAAVRVDQRLARRADPDHVDGEWAPGQQASEDRGPPGGERVRAPARMRQGECARTHAPVVVTTGTPR